MGGGTGRLEQQQEEEEKTASGRGRQQRHSTGNTDEQRTDRRFVCGGRQEEARRVDSLWEEAKRKEVTSLSVEEKRGALSPPHTHTATCVTRVASRR